MPDLIAANPAAGATILIMASAVLHALFSAVVKAGDDRLMVRTLISLTNAAVLGPFLFIVAPPEGAVWAILGLALVVHFAYHLLLVNMFHFGEFSVVYPFARGSAPLMIALGAGLVFGESLSPWQIGGLALISGGIVFLAFDAHSPASVAADVRKGLWYAALTGVAIALYTLIDTAGVRAVANPFSFIIWLVALDSVPITLFALARRRGKFMMRLAEEWRRGVFAGLLAMASFTFALLAFRVGAVAEIAALRETSIVFGVAIGFVFLGEKFSHQRLSAAVAIACGAVIIRVF